MISICRMWNYDPGFPAETLDPSRFNTTAAGNTMVHDDWSDYLPKTWASCWHELFTTLGDARNKLSWKGRFSDVLPVAYNYYSSGDEAFETFDLRTPVPFDGIDGSQPGTGRYSWQKQELYKGRDNSDDQVTSWFAANDTAGWGFKGEIDPILYAKYLLYFPEPGEYWIPTYNASQANGLSSGDLMSSPVFYPTPLAMFSATIDPDTRNRILAYAIPSLSTAIGHEMVAILGSRNINMNALDRPNGWWRPASFGNNLGERWLHSDMFEVAYCYVYKLFDDFAERGELK